MAANTNTKAKTTPAVKPVVTETKVEKPVTKKDMKIKMNATYCGDFGIFILGNVYTVSANIAEMFIKNNEAEEVKE